MHVAHIFSNKKSMLKMKYISTFGVIVFLKFFLSFSRLLILKYLLWSLYFLMQIWEGCSLPLAKLMPWNCCQDPRQIWEQWSWFNMGQGILFPFCWWRLQLFLGSWHVYYPEPFLCSHHLVWWCDSILILHLTLDINYCWHLIAASCCIHW